MDVQEKEQQAVFSNQVGKYYLGREEELPRSIRADVEALRVISTFGIVWYHSRVFGAEVAYSGLIVFVILSIYFGSNSHSKPKTVLDRARRLLVPYVVWSGFYGAASLFAGRPLLSNNYGLEALMLAGPGPHLWYLPFIFLVLIVVDRFRKRWSSKGLAILGGLMASAALLSAGYWREVTNAVGFPWAQYAHILPGVFCGFFVANAGSVSVSLRWIILLFVLGAAFFALKLQGLGLPYMIGVLVASLVLLTRFFASLRYFSFLKIASECAFGVYLIHPFFIAVLKRFGYSHQIFVPIVVFAFSTLTIWAARKLSPSFKRYAS